MIYKKQKGASILLTILIMAALLVVAIGVSRLSVGEIKLLRDIEKSLTAYYVADAGIEAAIYYERSVLEGKTPALGESAYEDSGCIDVAEIDICYDFSIETIEHPTEPLTKDLRIIKSNGFYKGIQRAIELNYELNHP